MIYYTKFNLKLLEFTYLTNTYRYSHCIFSINDRTSDYIYV